MSDVCGSWLTSDILSEIESLVNETWWDDFSESFEEHVLDCVNSVIENAELTVPPSEDEVEAVIRNLNFSIMLQRYGKTLDEVAAKIRSVAFEQDGQE